MLNGTGHQIRRLDAIMILKSAMRWTGGCYLGQGFGFFAGSKAESLRFL